MTQTDATHTPQTRHARLFELLRQRDLAATNARKRPSENAPQTAQAQVDIDALRTQMTQSLTPRL